MAVAIAENVTGGSASAWTTLLDGAGSYLIYVGAGSNYDGATVNIEMEGEDGNALVLQMQDSQDGFDATSEQARVIELPHSARLRVNPDASGGALQDVSVYADKVD